MNFGPDFLDEQRGAPVLDRLVRRLGCIGERELKRRARGAWLTG
jgi:hypothetical protein